MAAALSALLKRTTIDDHEEVLKACNASLKQSKGDLQAQHVRVIALIKLDRYDDALRVLDEQGDGLKQKAQLEHAYALYKVGELEEAKRVASHLDSSRGAKHVEAQAVRSPGYKNVDERLTMAVVLPTGGFSARGISLQRAVEQSGII